MFVSPVQQDPLSPAPPYPQCQNDGTTASLLRGLWPQSEKVLASHRSAGREYGSTAAAEDGEHGMSIGRLL